MTDRNHQQTPPPDISSSGSTGPPTSPPEQTCKPGRRLNLFLEGREERQAKKSSRELLSKHLAPVMAAAWTQAREEGTKLFIDKTWMEWVGKWPDEEEEDQQKRLRAKTIQF
ncbi:hypothetical protein V5O48_013642 [Marasmius crinis-equi]|uniref:Uncharacterized protein n=1 Tax=Marasmius crinis-equi TaxID=585013 RepID=A0ABR3EZH4_9AGAR